LVLILCFEIQLTFLIYKMNFDTKQTPALLSDCYTCGVKGHMASQPEAYKAHMDSSLSAAVSALELRTNGPVTGQPSADPRREAATAEASGFSVTLHNARVTTGIDEGDDVECDDDPDVKAADQARQVAKTERRKRQRQISKKLNAERGGINGSATIHGSAARTVKWTPGWLIMWWWLCGKQYADMYNVLFSLCRTA
jgi:hypothetical protein